MRIRRLIPFARLVAFVLTGLTSGLFVAIGMAALAWGYVPPPMFRMSGTVVAYTGILAVVCVLLLDRRKRVRPRD